MVKPKGGSGSSADGDTLWRGMVCGWTRRLKVTAPNSAFTLRRERNCSDLFMAESRFWHYLPFVALPILRLKLCSPAEFQ